MRKLDSDAKTDITLDTDSISDRLQNLVTFFRNKKASDFQEASDSGSTSTLYKIAASTGNQTSQSEQNVPEVFLVISDIEGNSCELLDDGEVVYARFFDGVFPSKLHLGSAYYLYPSEVDSYFVISQFSPSDALRFKREYTANPLAFEIRWW